LKPENILVNKHDVAKICDLGLSEVACANPSVSEHSQREDTSLDELRGTAAYIAPELVTDYRDKANEYHIGYASDTYSIAIIFWELLHAPLGTHPASWDPYRILVEAKYHKFRPKIDPAVPLPIVELIEKCWSEVPSERLLPETLATEILFVTATLASLAKQEETVNNVIVPVVPPQHREYSRSAIL
jgi:serine/threonine protein kinase